MASTVVDQPLAPEQAPRKGWIDRWDPEDAEFWETTGRGAARRNLVFSILAEHLGFPSGAVEHRRGEPGQRRLRVPRRLMCARHARRGHGYSPTRSRASAPSGREGWSSRRTCWPRGTSTSEPRLPVVELVRERFRSAAR